MKKTFNLKKKGLTTLLSFVLFFVTFSIKAQKEIETAKRYLTENASTQKLLSTDIDEMIISSSYLSPTTGWYHVYFNQTYQSIEVYNSLLNLAIKGDKVEYVANSFVSDIASKITIKAENLNLSPVQALLRAAAHVNLTPGNLGQIKEVKSTKLLNGLIEKGTFIDESLSNENIEVKLYWLQDDSKEAESKMALTWNVRFLTKDNQNSWNIHVDAVSGEILRKRDDVIHCSFGAPQSITTPQVYAMGALPQARPTGSLINNSYNVFDYPLESPNHGSRSVVSSPYTKFVPANTGPGPTNGWHNDGTTNYTTTRGNNVWAQEDANNNNGTGASPVSATLEFDYPYTQGLSTATGNQNAAITNLFYWNNVMHDVLWKYGFDEPSGNFQKDNQGRGGAGNDFVYADAQDGGGTSNANFSTPVDGGNGRMQMYLWTNANGYQPDGDFDNGVIAHEYGHGWSTRLTGGPANSSCLNNAEQGGEGWSDYAALMFTTNWSTLTPSIASANIARGIGTYALGEPITGDGIRPYRYSYDMVNVNGPVTYAKVGDAANFSEPHGIGSIWATMLWDMTWEIIMQDNQIVNDIYNTPANVLDMKGNIAALKLVNEGLRLQACSPSLVASRDAILAADQMLFGGRYRCSIGRAFARRGLGAYASTGSSSNDRIVTEDFTPFPSSSSLLLSSPKTASPVCTNSGFSYTATASSGTTAYSWTRPAVAGISNAAGSGNTAGISETLLNTTGSPIIVKYFFTLSEDVCGVAQPVSVTVNPKPLPTVATYSICQNAAVPNGEGLVAPVSFNNTVNGTLTTGSPSYRRGTGNNTTVYTAATSSGTNVYYQSFTFVAPGSGNVTFEITDAALTGTYPYDTYLTLYQTSFNASSPANNFLRGDDDSGTLPYSSKLTHNLVQGTTYVIVVTTYTNTRTGTFKLQSSVPVFPGTNNWYLNASGGSPLATGEIFNPVGVSGSGIPNTATAGTSTFYLANASFPDCRVPVTFTINAFSGGSLTGNAVFCGGSNSTQFMLSGQMGTVQKWQSSAGETFSNPIDIANTTTTLNVSGVTQTTYYRAVIQSGSCTSYSSSGSVMVDPATVGGSISGGTTVCTGTNSTLLTLANNVGSVQKWQSSTSPDFLSATDIANTNSTLTATNLSQTTYYRAVVKSGTCSQLNSTTATLTVDPATVGGSISGSATVCAGTNSTLLTLNNNVGSVQKWQLSTTINFTNATDISNTNNQLTVTNLSQTTYYRAVVKSGTCSQLNSTTATMTVDPATVGGSISGSATVCTGTNSTLLTLNNNVGSVQKWQSSTSPDFLSATDIANTNSTLTATNLSQTTYYRAVVKSGTCNQLNSANASITVTPTTVGGSISGSATVCAGTNSTLLTLNNNVGSVQKWQSATDAAFSSPNDITNTTNTLTATNLSQTTYYRAVVKSGTCNQLNSTNAGVVVNPLPVAGLSGTTVLCQNAGSPILTFTGNAGTAPYTFNYKINNGNTQTLSTVGVNVSTTTAQTTATPGTFTYTLVSISDANGCSQSQTGNAVITINALPSVSIPATSFCLGNSITLSPASGGTWLSNNPARATVTNAGVVNGVSPGEVNFTFTALGCSATTNSVTVKATPVSALTASKMDVCPNTEVSLDAHCSLPNAVVNWTTGGPTVFPTTSTTYRASCTLDGCVSNESSVDVRIQSILVDLKDLSAGIQPKAIVQPVRDNLSPTNLINAPVFPRLWTIIATGCQPSESAVFKLSGPISFTTIDNDLSYAMFANIGETYFSINHPNYGNGGSFPNGTYTLTVDLRSADGVGGPFPKNRVATGSLLATRTLQFTIGTGVTRIGVGEELETEFNQGNWIHLKQNPVNHQIAVQLSGETGEEIALSIINLQGQLIQQKSITLVTPRQHELLEVSNVSEGMYFLKAIKGDNVKTFKILKME